MANRGNLIRIPILKVVLTHEYIHNGDSRPFALLVAPIEVRDGETFLADSSYYDVVFGLVSVLDMSPTEITAASNHHWSSKLCGGPVLGEFTTTLRSSASHYYGCLSFFTNLPHYCMALTELHRQIMEFCK